MKVTLLYVSWKAVHQCTLHITGQEVRTPEEVFDYPHYDELADSVLKKYGEEDDE